MLKRLAILVAVLAAVGLAAAQAPIKIGISLSLSGDFSADGQGFQNGYKLWADDVNANGGLLGHQVQLDILNDNSSPDQVQTNYQKLISVDNVPLVLGPFSTLLTKPASVVANRYGYAMVEGAGGAPSVFDRGLTNVFDVALPVINDLDSFVDYITALPPGQRPTTVALATNDDPFTQPQVERARKLFEQAGLKVVSFQTYPSETTDFNPIADKIIQSKADIVVAGTFMPDIVAFMQRFRQQHYDPKAIVATAGPDLGSQFIQAVDGAQNAEGILVPNTWYAGADNPGNAAFVQAYVAKYGGKATEINGDAAEGYAAGQVLQAAVEKVGSFDNAEIIKELHSGDTFQSVLGPVRFNGVGENVSAKAYLFQWQKGQYLPVWPQEAAVAPFEYPKAPWQ